LRMRATTVIRRAGRRQNRPFEMAIPSHDAATVLACPNCGGRMIVLATIEDPDPATGRYFLVSGSGRNPDMSLRLAAVPDARIPVDDILPLPCSAVRAEAAARKPTVSGPFALHRARARAAQPREPAHPSLLRRRT